MAGALIQDMSYLLTGIGAERACLSCRVHGLQRAGAVVLAVVLLPTLRAAVDGGFAARAALEFAEPLLGAATATSSTRTQQVCVVRHVR